MDQNKRKNDSSISNNSLLPGGKISRTNEIPNQEENCLSITNTNPFILTSSTPNNSAGEANNFLFSSATCTENDPGNYQNEAKVIDNYLNEWENVEEENTNFFDMSIIQKTLELDPTDNNNNEQSLIQNAWHRNNEQSAEKKSTRSLHRLTPYQSDRSTQGKKK